MRNRILLVVTCLSLAITGIVFVTPSVVDAADGKNLKVLPKSLSKKEIKSIMKDVSKAVGKSCDGCHDLEDFSKDQPMKEKARGMFRLTNQINSKLKKDGFKKRVKCVTCHAGNEKPSK